MKLDLNEVVSHLGKHIAYEIDEPPIVDPESGLKCVEPVRGRATFSNTGSHVVIRGSFATSIEVDCARCLGNYQVAIEAPIEESFLIPGHIPDVVEEEEDGEESLAQEPESIFEENLLDLTELLRQNILLAMPIKPVCSEECKGLCPTCGRNLNEGPCECPQDTGGSAFAGLASLLVETEEDKDE
jgi:uncharacterized protein